MVLNDGSRKNCEAFYANEFEGGREFVGFNEKVKALVDDIKTAGYRVILATNPIFPDTTTRKRTAWAGLSVDDIEGYRTEILMICVHGWRFKSTGS